VGAIFADDLAAVVFQAGRRVGRDGRGLRLSGRGRPGDCADRNPNLPADSDDDPGGNGFQHHRTGHWMFWPVTITVHLHDTIETTGMAKENVPELRRRVREIISRLVDAPLEPGELADVKTTEPAQD
jgi:hypothetical protein